MKDTFAELQHVSWPTHTQAVVYTILVIVVSVLVALFISLFDFGFSQGLDWFVS